MGSAKDLNEPGVFAEGLVMAALNNDLEGLAQWLAGEDDVSAHPFRKWYLYFAERLTDMAPRVELGFASRAKRDTPVPKIGRNDPCPCQSGKKYKQCHLDKEEAVDWKIGSPTPAIRAMSVAQLIHRLPLEALDTVPLEKASPLAITEMAGVYHRTGQVDRAMELLKGVLDGEREDPHILFDYWIARYAEWLVEAGRPPEAEQFLMDEYDAARKVKAWQVAQKLAAYYLDQGDPDNAQTWVEVALETAPNNPFNHYLKGLLLHYMEQWEGAEECYQKALTLSDQFRDEERAYMTQLVSEGLQQVKNRQPVGDEAEEGVAAGDESGAAS
ncbi:MAG: SEC-C domain-containing protein [Magnetococcales bacterium]|nr:SEC-C domain-containing protein [Magnetococcales bacterium]